MPTAGELVADVCRSATATERFPTILPGDGGHRPAPNRSNSGRRRAVRMPARLERTPRRRPIRSETAFSFRARRHGLRGSRRRTAVSIAGPNYSRPSDSGSRSRVGGRNSSSGGRLIRSTRPEPCRRFARGSRRRPPRALPEDPVDALPVRPLGGRLTRTALPQGGGATHLPGRRCRPDTLAGIERRPSGQGSAERSTRGARSGSGPLARVLLGRDRPCREPWAVSTNPLAHAAARHS